NPSVFRKSPFSSGFRTSIAARAEHPAVSFHEIQVNMRFTAKTPQIDPYRGSWWFAQDSRRKRSNYAKFMTTKTLISPSLKREA
ncbi:MAG: hypothetical protein WA735_05790, partial [Candidatus Acidiferrales bacterium]